MLAPQRGLIAIAKERENQNSMDRSGYWFSAPKYKCVTGMHIPENVKLWASPGRAGGLLTIIIKGIRYGLASLWEVIFRRSPQEQY